MSTYRYRALVAATDMDWVSQHVPMHYDARIRGFVVLRDNAPVAALICDGWMHNSCQVHQIILDPLVFRHGYLAEAARYVFETAGKQMMIGAVPSDNAKALKLNKHLGFEEVGRVKDAVLPGVDLIVMCIRKEDCTWYVPITLEEVA